MGGGRKTISRAAKETAGWLLIAALVYAPWDYGATSASAIRHLNWLLAAVVVLSCVSLVDPGKRWLPSPFFVAIIGLLLLTGWGMVLNAHALFDTDYSVFMPMTSPLPDAPGSVGYALSLATVRRASPGRR
jgi:hypothetical protein